MTINTKSMLSLMATTVLALGIMTKCGGDSGERRQSNLDVPREWLERDRSR